MSSQRSEVIKAVLADEKYMAEIRQTVKDWRAGGSRSTPWKEVKKELGLK